MELAINNVNICLNWFSGADFVLDFSYLVLKEQGNLPSLSLGINNITYQEYISPLGHDSSAFADELYINRPPEAASAYIVATKSFGRAFEITGGIGRGEFVGYGPRSHLLNFDVFFGDKHEEFMFGFFGGVKFSVPGGPSLILETDGRDANLGIQYEIGRFKGKFGINKIELFTLEDLKRKPRINVDFSIRAHSFEKPKPGQIKILLADDATREPISGTLIIENGEKITIDIPYSGKKTVTLEPGIYIFNLTAPDYNTKRAKVPIRSNQETNLTIRLKKTHTPNELSSIELTGNAAEDFKNKKLQEAQKKLKAALQLYPENEKAKEGLRLVESAIQAHISILKEEARAEESVNLAQSITLWQDILNWEPSSEVETHIKALQSRLAILTKPKPKPPPKPKPKPTPVKKEPTLSAAEIENLYKAGIKEYIQGNYSNAVTYFRKILDADPNHAGAKRYLGKANEKL